jgi:diguanylate cyclase (GGDEF)-like protein/PAS domain S-box-containing protein
VRDQTVLLANQRAADLFEVPLEEVVGQRSPDYYVNKDERDAVVEQLLTQGYAENSLARFRTRSGRLFWGTLSGRVIDLDGDGCFLVGLHDVTAHKELEQRLRDLAMRDALTSLFNRRYFLELAELQLDRAERAGTPLTLCMFDADHFKAINDQHGHSSGDEVLKAIARAAESAVRGNDVLARIGGEEFAVLLPDTEPAAAARVAERIRCAIEALAIEGEQLGSIRPTVSVGLAQRAPGMDVEELLREADAALYRAKQSGRNCVGW